MDFRGAKSSDDLRAVRVLYVIGNGFDLHHGLATGLADFKGFIGCRRPDLQSTVEEYLCNLSGNWANLEEALAYFDVDQMLDHASNFLVSYAVDDWSDSYHHDYQYEINEVAEALSKELKSEFYCWIKQIQIPAVSAITNALKLVPGAHFLNFNYTPTLQELYSVDKSRILHIHGSIMDENDEIVLGHGWGSTNRPQLNGGQDPEEIDTRVMQGNAIIERYFEETFKPTDALIKQNGRFFGALGSVTDVFVWGHSLSAVDLPYFAEIATATAASCPSWHVSHYSPSSISANAAAMASIGVDTSKVHHHRLSEYVLQSRT